VSSGPAILAERANGFDDRLFIDVSPVQEKFAWVGNGERRAGFTARSR
jgi:hypothetical protein